MNSSVPMGFVARYLDSLSRQQVWFGIVAITIGILLANSALPEVGFSPLYILAICAACWALGAWEGYSVAIVAAFLALVPSLQTSDAPAATDLMLRVLVRIITFGTIAATISSFRQSYERELFRAHRDCMTGALNKEVFERRCATVIEGARIRGDFLLLAILDLDDFKAINNSQGHRVGDDVLREFAKVTASITRREDLFGRIGGDEFALLARIPSIDQGRKTALDIHSHVSAVLTKTFVPATCSMGALLIPPSAVCHYGELMHAADLLMYQAKRIGKNAVTIESASEDSVIKAPDLR